MHFDAKYPRLCSGLCIAVCIPLGPCAYLQMRNNGSSNAASEAGQQLQGMALNGAPAPVKAEAPVASGKQASRGWPCILYD